MEFRLLGSLEVADGGTLLEIGTAKQRALLAIFLLHPNQVMTTDRLAEELWAGHPPPSATATLQTYVFALRKALAPETNAEGHRLLVTRRPGYVLKIGSDQLDVTQFENLADEGGKALGSAQWGRASDLLRQALALWRGRALADFSDEPFAEAEAARLEEARLGALEQRLEADLALGRHSDIVGELETLLVAHPLREALWEKLMIALYRCGRQAEALRAYQRVHRALADELGIDPCPALRRLERGILLQEPWLESRPVPFPPGDEAEVNLPASDGPGLRMPVGQADGLQTDLAPIDPVVNVTLLLTDIEGSARLWEDHSDAMTIALQRHDALVASSVVGQGGTLVKTKGEGDTTFAVFADPSQAVAAALDLQLALATESWPPTITIRARMALHTGEAVFRDGHYYGASVNRCARLRTAAHGGQIVLSSATTALVADTLPAGASVLDLGNHRLKDLAEPQQVFQLCHVGLPMQFPPLRSMEVRRHNLPREPTSFVGREEEMAELVGLLAGSRLVTLAGFGGAGKTRLALRVSFDMVDAVPDGVWLVELAPLSDGGCIPQQVASVLGLRDEPGRPLRESLVNHLRSRRLLLVLDNCEHLIDDAAAFVETILAECREVNVLATSREPLGIPGEQICRVQSLTLPARDQPLPPLDLLASYSAVRLFADRAVQAEPRFQLEAENREVVVEIVRRLDGIPLAIELAAARVPTLGLTQIASRLGDRFRILSGGRRMLPRQRTLRALVDWSYDLLSPPEQALLRRLSVFAGGFELEAVETLCGGPPVASDDVVSLLTGLVEKSLVVVEGHRNVARYALLETIRQYGSERLNEAGEREDLEDRYRGWYRRLAESFESTLLGPGQVACLERLELERDNLRQALQGFAQAKDLESVYRLAASIWRFWWVRGYLSEGRGWLDGALTDAWSDPGLRAKALHAAGALAWDQGDFDSAQCYLNAGLALFTEVDDRRGVVSSLSKLGSVFGHKGEFGNARRLLDEALTVAKQGGDRHGMAEALSELGLLALHEGQMTEAGKLWSEGLALYRELGDTCRVFAMSGALGEVAFMQGDNRRARLLLEDSLAKAEEAGDQWRVARSLSLLGDLARREGERAVAADFQHRALVIRYDIGERVGIAQSLESLAAVAVDEGQHRHGVRLLGAAQALRETLCSPVPPLRRAEHSNILASTRFALGEEEFALTWDDGRALRTDEAVRLALMTVADTGSEAA